MFKEFIRQLLAIKDMPQLLAKAIYQLLLLINSNLAEYFRKIFSKYINVLTDTETNLKVEDSINRYKKLYIPAAVLAALAGTYVYSNLSNSYVKILPKKIEITVETINKTKPNSVSTEPPVFIKISKKNFKKVIREYKPKTIEELDNVIKKQNTNNSSLTKKEKMFGPEENTLDENICVQNCAQLLLPLEGLAVDPEHPLSSWLNRDK
jgi:hypothetical protein